MHTFSGVWPALITPFNSQGKVNVPVLRELVDYLLSKRVDGLYVSGSTGEGMYMSVAERKLLLETVLEQTQGQVPVIAHVGSVVLKDAIELAEHAAGVGADGVSSIIPPLYHNLISLKLYFLELATSAPDLPFFPYIFQASIDVISLMQDLMVIPNVSGTKYTGPNMYEFRQIVELRTEKWNIFSGVDEQCVFAAMFGATGNIGSTVNFMPGVYKAIHEFCRQGHFSEARDLQIQANHVTETLIRFDFPVALREAMRMIGFDPGPSHLPNPSLSEPRRQELHVQLAQVEFSRLVAM